VCAPLCWIKKLSFCRIFRRYICTASVTRVTVCIGCLTSRSEAVGYWTSTVEHNSDNGPHWHIRCALSRFVCLTLPRLPLRVHFIPIDSVSSLAASCPLRNHRFNVVAYYNKFPEILSFSFLLVDANSPSASFFSKVTSCAVNFVKNWRAWIFSQNLDLILRMFMRFANFS